MKIGIIQICSKLDYQENLQKIKSYLAEATRRNVEMVFLPECFYSMPDGLSSTPYLIDGANEHYQNIRSLSLDFKLSIVGGSAATLHNQQVVNRCFNFDRYGNDLGYYDKIHLFNCELKDKSINESDIYTPGNSLKLIELGILKLGLTICFDVRYPEMYRQYRALGANLVSISAAFTIPTGIAHWHTLVRARAIENQYFVVAPAQWGHHNDRIQTFGHSLVVDPWGEILVDAGDGEKLITVDIDLNQVEEVRKKVKLF
ncbi:MAG: hypothetical protein A2202_09155 [Bdellovibrionales bacterium RIFOXYA1_FULL_36_14]|nr:MAG: hypothetical protein A2202_09155 [Bdellovibrionales bacterium RIFOXYA1_FULL_36_14]